MRRGQTRVHDPWWSFTMKNRSALGILFLCCVLFGGCGTDSKAVIPQNPVAPALKDDVEKNIAAGRRNAAGERANPDRGRGDQGQRRTNAKN